MVQTLQPPLVKNRTRYKIQSGLPVPNINHRILMKYPFDLLKVGESFDVPRINWQTRDAVKAAGYRYTARAKNRFRFITREINKIVRVFRVR